MFIACKLKLNFNWSSCHKVSTLLKTNQFIIMLINTAISENHIFSISENEQKKNP